MLFGRQEGQNAEEASQPEAIVAKLGQVDVLTIAR
jgi:hypothetical protein